MTISLQRWDLHYDKEFKEEKVGLVDVLLVLKRHLVVGSG